MSQTAATPLADSATNSPPADSDASQVQKRKHEEEPTTASGRAKQQKQDLLSIEARHVGRSMDAFLSPVAMFNYGFGDGITYSTKETDLDEGTTATQRRYFRIYQHLMGRIAHFEGRIIDVEDHTFCEHEKLICIRSYGLAAARSDNISSLKAVVIDWLSVAPYNAASSYHPLPRNSKGTRGFNNPVIAELLCPIGLDWDDLAIQNGLRDGTIEVLPSQWPTFLYADDVPVGGMDMWIGFLRHPLLVKTLKHIYTSPSSVEGADSSRATRSSKAALAGMTGMTAGAIIDAVMKLRHSLSSCSTFQKNDKVTQNKLFYYGLLEVLEAEQAREQVGVLLQWYDRQLFPGREATSGPAPGSALARMRAQLGITDGAPEEDTDN